MFAPMSARFASSCSRNGTSAAATRHHLVRRDVHQLDHVGRDHLEVAVEAGGDEALVELALLVDVGRGLGDVLRPLPRAREYQLHLVGDAALARRVRYGVSTKPYSLTRANVESDAMRPMFGPSGVSIGQMRP